MSRISIGLVTAAVLLVVAESAPGIADEIHAVGVDDYTGAGALATNYSLITSWEDIGVDGSHMNYTSDPIHGTVDNVAFTYTITVAAEGGAGNLSIFSSSAPLLGDPDGLFAGGEGFSLTIDNITNSAVVFDGFTQFGSGGVLTGEGAIVNGFSYTRPGPNFEPAWILNHGPESTFWYESIGTTGGRYVEFQFSKVKLGDTNGDGVVNLLDVDPFISAIASGEYHYAADCNQDGLVNLLDVDFFITLLAGA